jgi:hypothetical protein
MGPNVGYLGGVIAQTGSGKQSKKRKAKPVVMERTVKRRKADGTEEQYKVVETDPKRAKARQALQEKKHRKRVQAERAIDFGADMLSIRKDFERPIGERKNKVFDDVPQVKGKITSAAMAYMASVAREVLDKILDEAEDVMTSGPEPRKVLNWMDVQAAVRLLVPDQTAFKMLDEQGRLMARAYDTTIASSKKKK